MFLPSSKYSHNTDHVIVLISSVNTSTRCCHDNSEMLLPPAESGWEYQPHTGYLLYFTLRCKWMKTLQVEEVGVRSRQITKLRHESRATMAHQQVNHLLATTTTMSILALSGLSSISSVFFKVQNISTKHKHKTHCIRLTATTNRCIHTASTLTAYSGLNAKN